MNAEGRVIPDTPRSKVGVLTVVGKVAEAVAIFLKNSWDSANYVYDEDGVSMHRRRPLEETTPPEMIIPWG